MERGFNRKILIIVFLIVGVLLINALVFKNFIPNSLSYFSKKPGSFLISQIFSLTKLSDGLFNASRIGNENAQLKIKNQEILGKLYSIETLERENESLRSGLKIAAKLSNRLVMAKIFNIEKGPTSSTLLIDRGENDGLKAGMSVLGSGNVLIGLVDKVFKNSASVILSDDPRFVVGVRVAGTQILANVKGDLENGLAISLIMAKDVIKEGDVILTSGLDNFKEGLVAGSISKIKAQSGDLFQKVWAKPAFDFSLGPNVFVISE